MTTLGSNLADPAPSRERVTSAQNRRRSAILKVRFLDRSAGQPMAKLGRCLPNGSGGVNGSFPVPLAPELPFRCRPNVPSEDCSLPGPSDKKWIIGSGRWHDLNREFPTK